MTPPARPRDAVHGHRDVMEFFAYGTLRPGGSNHHRIESCIDGPPEPSAMRGRMFASTSGAWPWPKDRGERIPGGDWLAYLAERTP